MRKPEPARYRTTNWSAYNAALRRRGSLLAWLDREMEWSAPKRGRPGRPETFSDAAMQFCPSIKVLFGLALRRIEPLGATDGVDGSRSRHCNVPHRVLSASPMKGAIQEGDCHGRSGSGQERFPGPGG